MNDYEEIKENLLKGVIGILEEHNDYCEESNKINICFITSIISQQIINCNDLITDLKNNNYSIEYIQDPSGYTNGKIKIILPSVIYYIKICEKYYEEIGKFATMYISKQVDIDEGFYKWDNNIMDYDKYKQQFNKLHINIAKQQREREIEDKKAKIAELLDEIDALQNEN